MDTRVRFIRRLITLGICLIGVLFALSQFGGMKQAGRGRAGLERDHRGDCRACGPSDARQPDRRRLVPNERLASELIRNDTILDDHVCPEASVAALASDTDIAVSSLGTIEPGLVVRITEATPEAVRITLTGDPVQAPQRAASEADLRAAALRALRRTGLLS